MSPFAVHLGPGTLGYAFAYFAWIRLGDPDGGRRLAAGRGATFFLLFSDMNDQPRYTP
jgi:hypothetical protein